MEQICFLILLNIFIISIIIILRVFLPFYNILSKNPRNI